MNAARQAVAVLAIGWLLTACALTAGCGHSSDKVGVSGRVSISDGTPIDRGMIEFAPVDATRKAGGGAVIVDGAYSIPAEHGLHTGKYLVRVYAPTPVVQAAGAPGALGLAPPRERVSSRFNRDTQLTAEVSGARELELNFEVEPASSKD